MGRRGPPKQPTALKLLNGTHRADRDGPLDEAISPGGKPVMPKHLNDDAKAFWDEVVPALVEMGVATAVDSAELGEMCLWWERYRRFGDLLDDTGAEEEGAYEALRMAGKAWDHFARIASRFGLTPADRVQLRVERATKGAAVQPRKRG